VRTDDSMCDHRYIEYMCGAYIPESKKLRNYKRPDWALYRRMRYDILPKVEDDGSNISVAAGEYIRIISTAMEEACPAKPILPR